MKLESDDHRVAV